MVSGGRHRSFSGGILLKPVLPSLPPPSLLACFPRACFIVGTGPDDRHPLYGKWLDADAGTLPKLDACGGRFGVTPDSPNRVIYHYQVQDRSPFTFGCFGPILSDPSGKSRCPVVPACMVVCTSCISGYDSLSYRFFSAIPFALTTLTARCSPAPWQETKSWCRWTSAAPCTTSAATETL